MAYRSLGGMKPLTFEARDLPNKKIGAEVDAEFYDQIKSYCKENRVAMSQFIRFAMARAMKTM